MSSTCSVQAEKGDFDRFRRRIDLERSPSQPDSPIEVPAIQVCRERPLDYLKIGCVERVSE
jgi:hypothetical protein